MLDGTLTSGLSFRGAALSLRGEAAALFAHVPVHGPLDMKHGVVPTVARLAIPAGLVNRIGDIERSLDGLVVGQRLEIRIRVGAQEANQSSGCIRAVERHQAAGGN